MVTVTVDVVSCLMYVELLLSLALFFCLQILAIAGNKAEKLVDWLAYRATWWAVAIQFGILATVGIIVWYNPTDSVIVGRTVLLILINTTWFITLRLTFEFADYLVVRRNS